MPRSLSTTSAAKKKAAATSQAQGKQDEDATATINKGEKEITTGPEISSKRDEADAFEKPTKEQITAAPGLPESGKVEPSSGERLSVKMPGPPVEEAKEQVIVSVPRATAPLWLCSPLHACKGDDTEGAEEKPHKHARPRY